MPSDRHLSSVAGAVLVISIVIVLLSAQVPSSSVVAQTAVPDVNTLGLLWENDEGHHNSTLWSVRWSPDGTMVAATYFDDTVTVYNAQTGKIIVQRGTVAIGPSSRCWGSEGDNADHMPLRTSDWSHDGKYLAVGGDSTNVTIYYTSNWTTYKTLDGHRGSVLALAWSPDDKVLASGSGTDKVDPHNMPENEIRIWNTTSWTTSEILKGHVDAIMSLRWSPNGTKLASASDDKTIRIWDRATWKTEKILAGHTLGVLDVAWSPDGKTLVSGSRDYKIMAWDYDSGKPTGKYTEANCVRSVDFHPSGRFYANSGVDEVQLKVRDATTGSIMKSFTDGLPSKSDIMSSRWSPDGKFLASGAGKEHTLRMYSFGHSSTTDSGKQLRKGLPGISSFLVIVAVAIVILYIPIIRKIKEGGR